jgi:NAD(P)-dependent dehydrogenase (short-subunit alcohol dehydrogenase family)
MTAKNIPAESITDQKETVTKTAIVTGGSRGFGRGVVEALVKRKMRVFAVARDAVHLEKVASEFGVETIAADAADEESSGRILQEVNPGLVVLCAGATPLLRPLHQHTWASFSRAWEVDTKSTFVWIREALLLPLKPGSHVVVFSSNAAIAGSPLSGGYAGAKRTNWLVAEYAAEEAARMRREIRFHCVIPTLSPHTQLGRVAAETYAKQAGLSLDAFLQRLPPPPTPQSIGAAVVELHENPGKWSEVAYRATANGLTPIGGT